MDFIRRHRLLLGVLSFAFIVLPGAIDSIWSLAERIGGANIIMPEISIAWFTLLTAPIGLALLVIILIQERKVKKQARKVEKDISKLAIPGVTSDSPKTAVAELHFANVEYHTDN